LQVRQPRSVKGIRKEQSALDAACKARGVRFYLRKRSWKDRINLFVTHRFAVRTKVVPLVPAFVVVPHFVVLLILLLERKVDLSIGSVELFMWVLAGML
jgi:hypothetical protein